MSLLGIERLRQHHGAGCYDRDRLRESYPAVPASLPQARHAVERFAAAAGARDAQLDAIRLAVSEALTNVVLHAYRARPGHIYVTAQIAGDELWVLIADNGCGIHAGHESDRLGVGLPLIAQMADGLSVVERSSGGTELRMRFVLPR